MSHERVSGFPEREGLTSGEAQLHLERSGELEKSGKIPGNLWIDPKLKCILRKVPGKSLGNF